MRGAVIPIVDASADDTVLSVKQRVFAANRELRVRQQRLMYRPGPRGIEPLANDETLGGAGVPRDGSAELDVLIVDLTAFDAKELGQLVSCARMCSTVYLLPVCNNYFNSAFSVLSNPNALSCLQL